MLLAGIVFRVVEKKIDLAGHPEYWMFGAWAAAETIIAASITLTGASAISMLALLTVPVVTLSARFSSRGIWVGVSLAIALTLAVAFGTDPRAVANNPPLVIAPASGTAPATSPPKNSLARSRSSR